MLVFICARRDIQVSKYAKKRPMIKDFCLFTFQGKKKDTLAKMASVIRFNTLTEKPNSHVLSHIQTPVIINVNLQTLT